MTNKLKSSENRFFKTFFSLQNYDFAIFILKNTQDLEVTK